MRALNSPLLNRCQDLSIIEISKRRKTYHLFVLLIAAAITNVGFSQTTVQNFGTGTGSHTSSTGSTAFIPNPTGSGTTWARGGAVVPNAPVVMATANNPLGTTNTYVRAVASSSTSVSKFSPCVGYTGSTEFYTSFKVLFGDVSAGSTATSGVWSFFQGAGTMYSDANNFTGAQVFTGLQFTFGAGGAISLTYRGGAAFINTGLSQTTFSSATVYTIEIIGNNKTSGTINYSYDGNPHSVAVQKFDLFINGTLIGDDLAEATLPANSAISSCTFISTNSTGNVANIFVDDVVTYNAVPTAIGSCPDADSDTICDDVDNCPLDENVDQTDNDGDGLGNPCDNCPNFGLNPDQTDTDGDAIGDLCDNCLTISNEDQENADIDNFGDACDNCDNTPNNDQTDSDMDGVGNACDNCSNTPNTDQANADGDALGDACDGCPNDPNKTAPGICGCGTPDTDGDGDGTADCNDGCPMDPNKTAPGICGCGTADTDTDGDGTPNCNDGCPMDPNKIAPGICGCESPEPGTPCNDGNAGTIMDAIDGSCNCVGIPAECMVDGDCPPTDADPCTIEVCGGGMCQTVTLPDSDGDGVCDAIDQCPNDPNRVSAAPCGCEVPNTDSDGDGTPDCLDGCPMDPLKIAPGVCGCGVADIDDDGDGTPNCNDGCPMDPNKIAPGVCGCGFADTDDDGDGTPNCNDGCPMDPNKIAPGVCGCGFADGDDDEDGTPDCIDGCPDDPDKIDPGFCGCFVAETDTDGDGTADCIDGCPLDPLKTAPGICGCGVSDTDGDGDGAADCNDLCPNDPNKIAAGACGCGVAETDTDMDGIPDCNDGCPLDPNKVAAGVCGCGIADNDTDMDGTLDCNDGCPMDPLKTAPGICGCGVSDTDGDGDGTPNCNDGCPMDPNKTAPGACGCGVADTDGDGDGTPNCNDGCPMDPNKTAPGVCGCGFLDVDGDNDGVCDSDDLCFGFPNVDADGDGVCDGEDGCVGFPNEDTDGDGICDSGDPCVGFPNVDTDNDGVCDDLDNCPDNTNNDQTDSDGDGLGDACDPCDYAVDGIENFDEENCRCELGYYAVSDIIGDLTGSGSRGAVPVTITGCQPCLPGRYCPDGFGSYPCPANTYMDEYGAEECIPCEVGYASEEGSVACYQIATCEDGIMNGDEEGVDCGGTNCAPCDPPNAVCGVITVYVDPNNYDYDGPGANNIWLIDSTYLDAGSTYDSEEPSIKVKRYLSNITFNWTTNGACIDVTPNGVINNPDKGIVYRSCYPAIPADLNKNKLYRLLISDEFGSDECSGTVKVLHQSGSFFAPSVHFIIPDTDEYISIARPQLQILDDNASVVTDLVAVPNPGSHSLHLNWNAEKSGDVEIRIIDISGRLAVSQEYAVISGQNTVMFDMSAQPSGMYAILIQTDTEVISTKWFKD